MPSEHDMKLHNEATENIIVGILCSGEDHPKRIIAHTIMDLLKRRGYEPKIRSCNELKDGTRI